MLQQTTVAVGIARFPGFLARFPTAEAMARAAEEEVLAAWSGLGYYARARNLHRAARAIATPGSFPRSARALAALPGVGAYTAAAVASIAFGEPVAAVDTNAARVVARLAGLRGDARRRALRRRVEEEAARLLDRAHPGDHNQALMDLGASICTAREPRCAACPLARGCRARATGRPEEFGASPRRAATRKITLAAGVARRGERLVLVPDAELVRGQGHLTVPLCRVPEGLDPREALARAWPSARVGACAGKIRHAVLDRRYTVHVFPVREKSRRPGATPATADELSRLPRGGLLGKILRLVDSGA